MFKRKNDKTEENVKDNKLKYTTEEFIELGKKSNVLNLAPPLYSNKDDSDKNDGKNTKKINYKKEIIKLVTISGHLNKVQILAIRAYLKKTTEEEQKDMYEKIQEEGLDAIINKFKSANVVKTRAK